MKLRYPLLLLSALFIFCAHYLVTGQAVYGDGIGYYAYLHSWYFDHDWDSTNEYKHIYTPENNNSFQPVSVDHVQITQVTSLKKADNPFNPGTALFLFPFYVLADGLAITLNTMGIPIPRNGYADIYQIFTGIGAIIWGVIGLWLTEKFIRQHSKIDDLTARWIPLFMFWTTHLLFYQAFDVIKSHFASYLVTVAFFMILFHRRWSQRWWHSYAVGGIAGLAMLIRPQDGLLAAMWLLWLLLQHKPFMQIAKEVIAFTSAFIIVISPMIFHLSTMYYSITEYEYLENINRNVSLSYYPWGSSLFHHQFGFIRRTPIVGLAILFTIYRLLQRKISQEWLILFIFFCSQFIVITIHGGWAVAAYGGRMYSSSLILIAWGLAELFATIKPSKRQLTILLLFLFFTFYNIASMASYILVGKGSEGGNFGTEQRTKERIIKLMNLNPESFQQ